MTGLLTNLFLLSHGANAVIALVLVMTSFRLYKRTNIRLVILMTVLMTSWMITNSLLILPILFTSLTVDSMGVSLIASWNIIGSAVVPAVFIIFIDAFEGDIDPKKIATAIATIMVAIFIALIGLSQGTEGVQTIAATIVALPEEGLITMRWSPIASLAIFPTVIACGIWTQRELNQSRIHAIDTKQISQIKFMKLGGILMFFIGPAFGIAGVVAVDGLGYLVIGTYLSEIVGYLFVSIGIIMITLAYTTSDAIAFLQPQRIDSIIAIVSTGIPVLQYDFSPKEHQRPELSLISGAITAIKAIMSEAFNVKSDVKQIAFDEKELMLNFKPLEEDIDIAFVLITDRKSSYLESSLERFSQSFIEVVPKQVINGIQLTKDEEAESIRLLRKSFGL